MLLKAIIDEDFINYKKPSMFIATCYCNWKCCKEGGFDIAICQNSPLAQRNNIYVFNDVLLHRYLDNQITCAIVFGGLEPFMQFSEIYHFIRLIRKYCNDDIVIYTGFNKYEIESQLKMLKVFANIIVKFGRYIPNNKQHYDKVLGVNLASDNQYAEVIN